MFSELPKITFSKAEKKAFEPLLKLEGERVSFTKVAERIDNTFEDIIPIHMGTGYLQLYDRGGGPSFYIGSINEWFASSWIKIVYQTDIGVEVLTENSIYLIRKTESRVNKIASGGPMSAEAR